MSVDPINRKLKYHLKGGKNTAIDRSGNQILTSSPVVERRTPLLKPAREAIVKC